MWNLEIVCGIPDCLHEILFRVVACQWPVLVVDVYTRSVVRSVQGTLRHRSRLLLGTTRLRTRLPTLSQRTRVTSCSSTLGYVHAVYGAVTA